MGPGRQRLLPTSEAEAADAAPDLPTAAASASAPLALKDLSGHERHLLRELCLGFNSLAIPTHQGMTWCWRRGIGCSGVGDGQTDFPLQLH